MQFFQRLYYTDIYLFKNTNNRTLCEICSKVTIKTPLSIIWTDSTYCFGVSIADFKQVNSSWVFGSCYSSSLDQFAKTFPRVYFQLKFGSHIEKIKIIYFFLHRYYVFYYRLIDYYSHFSMYIRPCKENRH